MKDFVEQSFDAGHVIFEEGTKAAHAYLICEGEVEVSMRAHGGEKRILAVLGENSIFGEMALIDDALRSATVTAVKPTRCIVVDKSRFAKETDNLSPFMHGVFRVLCERLRKANESLNR